MQLKVLGLAAIAACAAAASAWAHHSHGNYQMSEYTSIEGTVRELHLVNPHAWIYLEVLNADGRPELWALEGGGVRQLTEAGITGDMVKVGDTVSARCHQLRDGSNGCLLGFLTSADGVEREWD